MYINCIHLLMSLFIIPSQSVFGKPFAKPLAKAFRKTYYLSLFKPRRNLQGKDSQENCRIFDSSQGQAAFAPKAVLRVL